MKADVFKTFLVVWVVFGIPALLCVWRWRHVGVRSRRLHLISWLNVTVCAAFAAIAILAGWKRADEPLHHALTSTGLIAAYFSIAMIFVSRKAEQKEQSLMAGIQILMMILWFISVAIVA